MLTCTFICISHRHRSEHVSSRERNKFGRQRSPPGWDAGGNHSACVSLQCWAGTAEVRVYPTFPGYSLRAGAAVLGTSLLLGSLHSGAQPESVQRAWLASGSAPERWDREPGRALPQPHASEASAGARQGQQRAARLLREGTGWARALPVSLPWC